VERGDVPSDHEDVRRLLADYCLRLDDGDHEGVAELFADDGEFEVMGATHTGRRAIADMYKQFDEMGAPRGKHVTLNSSIEVRGDEATVLSDFVFLAFDPDGSTWRVFAAGRYEDLMVRQDRWRFRRRRDMLHPGTDLTRLLAPGG